ncbi:MAG: hypothetical protein QOG60_1751 [Frankiaceae bacterium]|nr:hypothetical protein [Frankiaceae bacterium]
MADWDDVRRVATALPEVIEEAAAGHRKTLAWQVKKKSFLWERPLGKNDRNQLGDAAPNGPILAARVPDEGVKEVLVASDPDVYFTIPHFDGYAAILVRLDALDPAELDELATEAWLSSAPKRLAKAFLEGST